MVEYHKRTVTDEANGDRFLRHSGKGQGNLSILEKENSHDSEAADWGNNAKGRKGSLPVLGRHSTSWR